jgi:hypothetical protein
MVGVMVTVARVEDRYGERESTLGEVEHLHSARQIAGLEEGAGRVVHKLVRLGLLHKGQVRDRDRNEETGNAI